MNRKERKPILRPAVLIAAGIVLNLAGGALTWAAAATYRDNLSLAGHVTEGANYGLKVDVTCTEAAP
jgi:hypothetical protein